MGIEIINLIDTLELSCVPDIIVISEDSEMLTQLIKSHKVDYFIAKNSFNFIENLKYILSKIVINSSINNTNQFILSELNFLGLKIKLNGTKYLLESISYIYNSNNYRLIDNLEKNVYPELAKRHNTSISNIKSNILKSINTMYLSTDSKKIKKYFLFDDDIKPTPKLLIEVILNKLMIS